MNQTEFTVSRFENRNGSISWRVAGLLHGVRIRKNFKTKEDAAAEKAALEIADLQATAGMRAATTFLSEVQLREAEDAFRGAGTFADKTAPALARICRIHRIKHRAPSGNHDGCFDQATRHPAHINIVREKERSRVRGMNQPGFKARLRKNQRLAFDWNM